MALRWLRGAAAPGRRRLRALLLGVAILWTAYVIGINAFLATGWIQHEINTSQGAAVITWGPAWSLIPARVHVRDFAVRVADRTNIEFLIHLDRASAWVDLPALLHRTFHANGVDADGVQLRIRFDYEPYHRAAAEREMPLLPTIEGYADPPLASYVVGTPPPNRATSHMWMVNLTRVRVSHLDEVWIQQFRWTGEATAAGQFHLLPELELGVGPAEAHFLSGGIRLGKSGLPVAASLTGPFSTTIHTFDIQGLRHALDFLHFVDTDGDLALAGSDLAWVNHFLAGAEIERGKGPLRFRPVLREGRFAPGAEIAFDTPEVELVTKPVRVSAGVHLRGRASPGLGLTTELRVEARRLAVGLGSSHGQRLVGGEGRFTVRAARLDLADLALDSEMRLDVGGLRTDDLTSWTEVERIRGIDPVGGSAQVDASWFKPRERLGRGRVVVRAPELTTRIGGTSIDGPAELDVEMEAGPPRSPPLIKLDGTRLDLGNPDGGAWWSRPTTSVLPLSI